MSDSDYSANREAVWAASKGEEYEEGGAARNEEEPASPKVDTPDHSALVFPTLYQSGIDLFEKKDYPRAWTMFERCKNVPKGFDIRETHDYIKRCEKLIGKKHSPPPPTAKAELARLQAMKESQQQQSGVARQQQSLPAASLPQSEMEMELLALRKEKEALLELKREKEAREQAEADRQAILNAIDKRKKHAVEGMGLTEEQQQAQMTEAREQAEAEAEAKAASASAAMNAVNATPAADRQAEAAQRKKQNCGPGIFCGSNKRGGGHYKRKSLRKKLSKKRKSTRRKSLRRKSIRKKSSRKKLSRRR